MTIGCEVAVGEPGWHRDRTGQAPPVSGCELVKRCGRGALLLGGQADGAREDARRVALSLLQASQAAGRSGAGCPAAQAGGFAGPWDERIEPDKPKVPSPQVSAVRVAGLAENANCSQPIRRSTPPGRL